MRNKCPQISLITGTASLLLVQTILGFANPLPGSEQLSTQFGISSVAIAAPRYTPRSSQGKAPRRTVGTGSRGCLDLSEAPTVTLTLLVANEVIGYTTAGHPTFFWHLSGPVSVPMEFSLVEPGNPETIYKQTIANPIAGINQIQLPADKPELVPGKLYKWSVALVCNPERRSADVIAPAFIQRELPSPALAQQLSTATSKIQQSEIFAANSFWYDALAVLAPSPSDPDQQAIVQDRLSLLEQVDLTAIVQQEKQRPSAQVNSQ